MLELTITDLASGAISGQLGVSDWKVGSTYGSMVMDVEIASISAAHSVTTCPHEVESSSLDSLPAAAIARRTFMMSLALLLQRSSRTWALSVTGLNLAHARWLAVMCRRIVFPQASTQIRPSSVNVNLPPRLYTSSGSEKMLQMALGVSSIRHSTDTELPSASAMLSACRYEP